MTWVEREDGHFSSPYRIYRSVQGWDSWIYAKQGGACLGKGYRTLDLAKRACEQHKESKREPA